VLEGRRHAGGIEWQRPALPRRPLVEPVRARLDAAGTEGACVERLELDARDGPAARRHPVAGLEVDRVEWHEAAAAAVLGDADVPDVGPARELAVQRRRRREEVAVAGQSRERRPVAIRLDAAGFDQADAPGRTRELAGDRHARRAAAHDADVAHDLRALRESPRVDDHTIILRDRGAEVQR
jgi:hypothetical protein